MPEFKSGVRHYDMDYELTRHYARIDDVHMQLVGRNAIITSARDGVHMRRSLHSVGRAIDLRISDMKPGAAENVVRELRNALGPRFDVILESNHIHLEYDP